MDRRFRQGALGTQYVAPKPYVAPPPNRIFARPPERYVAPPPPPKQIVAEVGEDFTKLAERLGIETQDLIKANVDDTSIKAGAVYNVPKAPDVFYDPVFEAAPTSEEGIVYPDAFNPQLFREYISEMGTGTGAETRAFQQGALGAQYGAPIQKQFDVLGVGDYYGQDIFQGVEKAEDLYEAVQEFREGYGAFDPRRFKTGALGAQYGETRTAEEVVTAQKELDVGKYYQEGMFEMPGIPLKYRWELDENGQWVDRGEEAIFDALYEANGIDPNDPDAVEWFWSFADEDLLYAGEFFDVIEWPSGSGGYGGYGRMPTPSRQSRRGQQPTRGDYASYLSLTSWSI